MRVHVHPDAGLEAGEAANWYEERCAGLGRRFTTAVDEVIQRLADGELGGSPVESLPREIGIRRVLLRSFPIAVVFESTDVLHVLAIAHTARRPNYWLERRSGGSATSE